ncbi:CsbD family protein [Undibacterium sp. Di27W]|uniref:CsbD family protein n=1 Tax=Undibacterium sp. Di27W TaxID=3413036 RepID=UPI003BF0A286
MNKDQIKGTAKDIAGKVQESAGKIIGSEEQEIKGLQKQVEGKLEKNIGDAREAIEKTVKKVTNP